MTNQQLIKAFHQTEAHFFSHVSKNQLKLSSLDAYYTGVSSYGLNPVFYKGQTNLKADLSQCNRFFSSQNTPWVLVIPEYSKDSDLNTYLSESGFSHEVEGVAMYLVLASLNPPPKKQVLSFRIMNNDIDVWNLPSIDAFESTPEIAEVYATRHKEALEKGANMMHISGYLGDKIVSSMTITFDGSFARIDDVATLPSEQKKGFAAELMRYALELAQEQGITHCFLEASTDGLGLYQKLGFQELFKNDYLLHHD
jgi:ribosomal protein S18 acetylase RimI-like enzyme